MMHESGNATVDTLIKLKLKSDKDYSDISDQISDCINDSNKKQYLSRIIGKLKSKQIHVKTSMKHRSCNKFLNTILFR